MGRGSVSGANKYGKWTGCLHCNLRLSYVPTWGSPGDQRKAGPLPADVERQVELKQPAKGSVDLKEKKITMDAQERSLEEQLQKVRQKKADYVEKEINKDKALANYPKAKDHQEVPKTLTTSTPSTPTVVKVEEMSKTPGRKARRAHESPEDLEYQNRGQVVEVPDEEDWDRVSP